mmetsp:Transcript_3498/g.10720  ORF Transcript_3498/g.10720 Transcript_3498/m.10720 type:complete len:262 (+) Transcript_3498:156-941(+)
MPLFMNPGMTRGVEVALDLVIALAAVLATHALAKLALAALLVHVRLVLALALAVALVLCWAPPPSPTVRVHGPAFKLLELLRLYLHQVEGPWRRLCPLDDLALEAPLECAQEPLQCLGGRDERLVELDGCQDRAFLHQDEVSCLPTQVQPVAPCASCDDLLHRLRHDLPVGLHERLLPHGHDVPSALAPGVPFLVVARNGRQHAGGDVGIPGPQRGRRRIPALVRKRGYILQIPSLSSKFFHCLRTLPARAAPETRTMATP